jgi:DUF971 family protein
MKQSQRPPNPTNITYHQASRLLSLEFDDGQKFDLSSEFLRVFTPSAEARGHGPGQEVLQTGKREVAIERIEPVGNYAICPVFSDGHDTGIYSWDMLYEFGRHHDELWAAYLEKIEAAGASREAPANAAATAPKGGCGGGSCSK